MPLLGSTSLYYTLPWVCLALLDSTTLYHGFMYLYMTLHSTWLYLTLLNSIAHYSIHSPSPSVCVYLSLSVFLSHSFPVIVPVPVSLLLCFCPNPCIPICLFLHTPPALHHPCNYKITIELDGETRWKIKLSKEVFARFFYKNLFFQI